MRLFAALAALLIAAHRDESGQVNFFKDLWNRATGAAEGIKNAGDHVADLVKWFGTLAVNVISDAGDRLVAVLLGMLGMAVNAIVAIGTSLRDLLTWFGTIATNTLRDAGGAMTDLLRWFGTVGTNLIRDAAGAMKDLATWFGTVFVNVVSAAAGKLTDVVTWFAQQLVNVVRDAGGAITDLIKWFGTITSNAVTDAAGKTAGSIDDAAGALKDLPGEMADKTKALLEETFGFSADLFEGLNETAMRMYRGEFETVEEFFDALLGHKPNSTILEKLVFSTVIIPGMLGLPFELGQIATRAMVFNFRSKHATALLDPDDLRDAFLRGYISEQFAHDELRKAGFSEDGAQNIMKLWQELPPPSDLIRMAVREAFSPDIVARFGQHDDFPAEFEKFAKQQGYSKDWALAYWAAHWELPSAEQGFEMLHRGVIDADTLQLLLRALDVMPFWRGKLTDIAYNTVTRVDTRRLFAAGVWDRARVKLEYLRQGYRPEDADAITEWTVRTYGEDTAGARDLTQAAIVQAFKQGRIGQLEAIADLVDMGYDEEEADFIVANAQTQLADMQASAAEAKIRDVTQSTILRAYGERIVARGEAESMLADLGYTADGVELLLAVEDFNTQHDLAALRAKVIEQQFRQGAVSGGDARAQLASAGYGVERADLVVQRWEIQYGAKDRDLTEAQLRNALQRGLIDSAVYVRRVGALGYSDEDAKILLALAGGATTEDVRQLSRAQVIDAYKRTIISRATAEQRLGDLGFAGDDVQLQLAIADQDLARAQQQQQKREADAAAAAVKDLARTSIEGAYRRGIISRDDALARLVALGFRPDDAELLLQVVDAAAAAAAP